MCARAAALWRWWRKRGIGVEAAVAAEADQESSGKLFQPVRQLGGVVASIEDEQRRCTIGREASDQVFDLFHRDRVGVTSAG